MSKNTLSAPNMTIVYRYLLFLSRDLITIETIEKLQISSDLSTD